MIEKKIKCLVIMLFNDNTYSYKNFFFINSWKKFKNTSKQNSFLIFYGKNILFNFLKVYFYLLFSQINFKKNFFLLFRFKNLIKGHYFLPDWPGIYQANPLIVNFIHWIKKLLYIFFYQKKICVIILKIN